MARRPAPWEAAPVVEDVKPAANVQAPWADAPPVDDPNGPGGSNYTTPVQTVDIPASSSPQSDVLGDNVDKRPTSFWQGALEGAEKPFNNAARALSYGMEKVGLDPNLGLDPTAIGLAPNVDAAEAAQKAQQDSASSQGSGLGRFVGEMAGTAPAAAIPGGVLAQGAAAGALLTNKRDPLGVAIDAGVGAAAGKVGQKVITSLSHLAAPIVPDALKTLISEGVRVTPGQVGRAFGGRVGNAVARTEDRAISTPFVGDSIVGGRNAGMEDFARATINRAVGPIGESLPENVPVGRRAVQWAGDKLSGAYDALLPRITATGDQQFVSDLATIHSDAATMAPARTAQFNSILNDLGRFWQGGQNIDGAALKQIDERLNMRIRRLSGSQDADQQDLGDALSSVREAVYDLAARQNPGLADDLRAINQGWKSLTQVEKASGNSKAAVTPAGYSQAVKQSSDTVRRRGYARGQALNQDLSDAASDVLPSEIADSGTAGRWQQSNVLANLIGAAQIPAYAAARAIAPAFTRQTAVSPRLAQLLRYGALAAPEGAAAAIDTYAK